MDQEPKSIDIADFISSWPQIVRDMDSGVVSGIDVVRDGHVVALVRPPLRSLHGYLRGSVQLPDGCDLTAPVFVDEAHAESGRVHE